MKSNDDIPEDEMLLAEAIAAAKARGLGWARHTLFLDKNGFYVDVSRTARGWQNPPRRVTACCVLGAAIIAGYRQLDADFEASMTAGNDYDSHEMVDLDRGLSGQSLGWAFRCAMTQDEP